MSVLLFSVSSRSRLVLLSVLLVLSCSSDPPSSIGPEASSPLDSSTLAALEQERISFHQLHHTGAPLGAPKAASAANDRAVLKALYTLTNGRDWINKRNWMRDDVPLSRWQGVYTNSSGRVVGLFLSVNRLRGILPFSLSQLDQLEDLWLWGNDLSSPIPPEYGQLANLEYLALDLNRLHSPLPAELGRLSRLKHLTVSLNQLTGSIPSELGPLSRSLSTAEIAYNRLSGCIPSAWSTISYHDFDRTNLPFCSENEEEPHIERNFSIELVFIDDELTPAQQDMVRQAADRWKK